jgi:hypothetical protein
MNNTENTQKQFQQKYYKKSVKISEKDCARFTKIPL